jgi:hypothetical protein
MPRFLALLTLAVAPVFANEPTLYGLAGAELVFESLDTNTASLGLSEQSVRASVELRLRRAGFDILPLTHCECAARLPPHIACYHTWGWSDNRHRGIEAACAPKAHAERACNRNHLEHGRSNLPS